MPFKLYVPTVLESNSFPDTQPGDLPVRYYYIEGRHKAVRLVFRLGTTIGGYWGIEETDWGGAPALADRSFRARSRRSRVRPLLLGLEPAHGRPPRRDGDYWVVNDLLNDLSNETMLAIAKGLKPLTTGK